MYTSLCNKNDILNYKIDELRHIHKYLVSSKIDYKNAL